MNKNGTESSIVFLFAQKIELCVQKIIAQNKNYVL